MWLVSGSLRGNCICETAGLNVPFNSERQIIRRCLDGSLGMGCFRGNYQFPGRYVPVCIP